MDAIRRRLLSAMSAMSGGLLLAGTSQAPAADWLGTPPQAQGPFYPLSLPLDKDNDLVTVAGRSGVARGEITNVVGRVLDEQGRALRGVLVEIWQCNAFGRYQHEGDTRDDVPLDPNFQGYGQFVTGTDGAYRFRTIKPVAYPGRAPHIHFKLKGDGVKPLTTQMYVEGARENDADFLLRSLRDPKLRRSIVVALAPAPSAGELVGNFDIVLISTKA
jgi:protocatechuate 3,4-dioxygenase, beta subunit